MCPAFLTKIRMEAIWALEALAEYAQTTSGMGMVFAGVLFLACHAVNFASLLFAASEACSPKTFPQFIKRNLILVLANNHTWTDALFASGALIACGVVTNSKSTERWLLVTSLWSFALSLVVFLLAQVLLCTCALWKPQQKALIMTTQQPPAQQPPSSPPPTPQKGLLYNIHTMRFREQQQHFHRCLEAE